MWKGFGTTLSGACIAQGNASYRFSWLRIQHESVVCDGRQAPYDKFSRIPISKHLARLTNSYGMLAAQVYFNVASRIPNSLLRLRVLAIELVVLLHTVHRSYRLVIAILGLPCQPDVPPALGGGMQLAGLLLCASGASQVIIPLQTCRCTLGA